MKKVLLLLVSVLALTTFTGCQKEKPYSYYQIAVKQDSWSGADNMTYNVMSDYLLANNFIYVDNIRIQNALKIEGDNAAANDAAAVAIFQERLATLKSKMPEIEQTMLNAPGTPCTISFNYELYSGRTTANVMDGERITVICRNDKEQ